MSDSHAPKCHGTCAQVGGESNPTKPNLTSSGPSLPFVVAPTELPPASPGPRGWQAAMPKRAGQQAQQRPVSTQELRLTGTPRHGEVEVAVKATRVRSRLAFLAGRDNALEPINLLLIQQGVLAETGIAPGDITRSKRSTKLSMKTMESSAKEWDISSLTFSSMTGATAV